VTREPFITVKFVWCDLATVCHPDTPGGAKPGDVVSIAIVTCETCGWSHDGEVERRRVGHDAVLMTAAALLRARDHRCDEPAVETKPAEPGIEKRRLQLAEIERLRKAIAEIEQSFAPQTSAPSNRVRCNLCNEPGPFFGELHLPWTCVPCMRRTRLRQ
jgi:hypothetical protein